MKTTKPGDHKTTKNSDRTAQPAGCERISTPLDLIVVDRDGNRCRSWLQYTVAPDMMVLDASIKFVPVKEENHDG